MKKGWRVLKTLLPKEYTMPNEGLVGYVKRSQLVKLSTNGRKIGCGIREGAEMLIGCGSSKVHEYVKVRLVRPSTIGRRKKNWLIVLSLPDSETRVQVNSWIRIYPGSAINN